MIKKWIARSLLALLLIGTIWVTWPMILIGIGVVLVLMFCVFIGLMFEWLIKAAI